MSVKEITKKLGLPYQQVYGAVQKMATTGTVVTKASAPEKAAFQATINAQAPAYTGIANDLTAAKSVVAQDGWESARETLGITCEIPDQEKLDAHELNTLYRGWVKAWVSTSTSKTVATGLVALNKSLGHDEFNSLTDQLVAYYQNVKGYIASKSKTAVAENVYSIKPVVYYDFYRMGNQYLTSSLRDKIEERYDKLPKVKYLWRGIGGAEADLFKGADVGDYVSLKPLISTSSLEHVAHKFNSEVILKFEDVKGRSVFSSDRLDPDLFTMHSSEKETILFGNMYPWRIVKVDNSSQGSKTITLRIDTGKAVKSTDTKATQGIAKSQMLSADQAAKAKTLKYQGYLTDQIAAKLGMPPKSVYDYLHYGIYDKSIVEPKSPIVEPESSTGKYLADTYKLLSNNVDGYKITISDDGKLFTIESPLGGLPTTHSVAYVNTIYDNAKKGDFLFSKGKAILKAFGLDYKKAPEEPPKIEPPKIEPIKPTSSGSGSYAGYTAKVVGSKVMIQKPNGDMITYAKSSNYVKMQIENKDMYWKLNAQGIAVLKALGLKESLREAGESLHPISTSLCGTVPLHTLAHLKHQAMQWSFLELDGERKTFEGVLSSSIENGWTRKQLSGVLQHVFNEGIHRVDPHTGKVVTRVATASWAKTVARTELNRAFSSGEMIMYDYAGVKKVEWTSAGDSNTCDYCSVADGEIVTLGDPFPGVDVDSPPAHPNCECALMASDEDLISKRSDPNNIAWASRGGRTAEEYEQQFGFKHRIDQ